MTSARTSLRKNMDMSVKKTYFLSIIFRALRDEKKLGERGGGKGERGKGMEKRRKGKGKTPPTIKKRDSSKKSTPIPL